MLTQIKDGKREPMIRPVKKTKSKDPYKPQELLLGPMCHPSTTLVVVGPNFTRGTLAGDGRSSAGPVRISLTVASQPSCLMTLNTPKSVGGPSSSGVRRWYRGRSMLIGPGSSTNGRCRRLPRCCRSRRDGLLCSTTRDQRCIRGVPRRAGL